MSLKEWADNGWLKPHTTTRKQICDLFAIVERDMESAAGEDLSPDWQFAIAYNAVLKLCTVLLYAEGYRPENSLAHFRTLQALRLILGDKFKSDVDYLDGCRVKRNKAEYDTVGVVTPEEAQELLGFAVELKQTVMHWLNKDHRPLVP
jgi:uncharacterized protein (UPF0332 family)